MTQRRPQTRVFNITSPDARRELRAAVAPAFAPAVAAKVSHVEIILATAIMAAPTPPGVPARQFLVKGFRAGGALPIFPYVGGKHADAGAHHTRPEAWRGPVEDIHAFWRGSSLPKARVDLALPCRVEVHKGLEFFRPAFDLGAGEVLSPALEALGVRAHAHERKTRALVLVASPEGSATWVLDAAGVWWRAERRGLAPRVHRDALRACLDLEVGRPLSLGDGSSVELVDLYEAGEESPTFRLVPQDNPVFNSYRVDLD